MILSLNIRGVQSLAQGHLWPKTIQCEVSINHDNKKYNYRPFTIFTNDEDNILMKSTIN